ncbi:ABC transporter [Vairimorpha necatrix]|uniref:ABC transporter n=1 Tax=Vairimorpha necatrix TaxID=6039 RepID=A0AAX4J8R2_9MICR
MTHKRPFYKHDLDILNDLLVEYVFSKPLVRTFVLYIVIGTFGVCWFNVLTVEATSKLTNDISKNNDLSGSLFYFAILTILSITMTELNNFIFVTPVQHVFRMTGKNSFKNFINMDLTQYNKIGCGEIQTIIDRESKAISELVEVIFINVINILFTIILACFSIYQNLGIVNMFVILITLIIYIYTTIKIVHWRTQIRKEYNASQQLCSNHLHDSLINHETILSYKTEENESLKYETYVSEVETNCNRTWRSLSVLYLVNKFIFAIQCFIIITIGNFGFFTVKMAAKDVVFYISINRTLYSSFGNLGFFYSRYTQAILNAKTSFKPEFIEEDKDLQVVDNFTKEIKILDGAFAYNTKIVLQNINFTINKGEKVAIIGKNGSGKTSLIKMLMRFENYNGEIFLDDYNVKNISNASFRSLIAYAPQTSFLFNETVYYNLTYGMSINDKEEVYEVSKKINVHDSINRLENQYETQVGDKGHRLSGGERQKIILLRCALKNAQIIILDEPTAALDKKAEYEILNSLMKFNVEKTVIMVLQNYELLHMFDKVIKLQNNTVTSHIKRDGIFETLKI